MLKNAKGNDLSSITAEESRNITTLRDSEGAEYALCKLTRSETYSSGEVIGAGSSSRKCSLDICRPAWLLGNLAPCFRERGQAPSRLDSQRS